MKFEAVLSNVFSPLYKTFVRKMSKKSNLQNIIADLEKFASLKYAEPWDNVGLLIEPNTSKNIEIIFLTNDLTEPVLKEALNKNSDLIISYHPPIFAPLKRITQKTWKERIVSICLENKIALYSPHTAWDVANNGVNDWLASSLPYEEICPIQPIPDLIAGGIGRKIKLHNGITLSDAIKKIKQKIGIANIHVAIGNEKNLNSVIQTVAICAGSGVSVLKNVDADLYLTGEMSHHDVLNATQNNISVILCNHSNSERGYLKEFKIILDDLLKEYNSKTTVLVSEYDVDPLHTY